MSTAVPHSFDTTTDSFESDVLEASRHLPVLVDFWACWCGPCKTLMPILEKLAQEYAGQFRLAKVNIDEQAALASRFGVRSVPTVKLFRHGEVVDEFMGVQPELQIRTLLDAHIERESDRLATAAMEAQARGDADKAMEMMQAALAREPGEPRMQIPLAELYLLQERYAEAEEALRALPADLGAEAQVTKLFARLAFARIAEQAPPLETLEQAIADDPADMESRYRLAARLILRGEYEQAMEQLLEMMRRDRGYGDDAGREGLLKLFEMLDNEGELVSRYRRLMFNALH